MPTGDGTRDPAYLLYRGGRAIASAVPDGVLFPGARLAGTVVSRFNRARREVVARNLARVVPPSELDRTISEAFQSYARYWMEALRMPKPGLDEIRQRTSAEGVEHLNRLRAEGQGVVFVTPHVGNWDVAGAWLASQGWRVIAVAEELEPPELFELFRDYRQQVGVEVHPLGYGSSARALIAGLRAGAAIGLVADRDITGSGVEVEFFGEKTYLPSGPAVLAARVGVPIVPGAVYQRPGGRYHGVVLEPIAAVGSRDPQAIREVTQRVAHALEDLIRRDPGQWHLFQPNWPADPGYRGS